ITEYVKDTSSHDAVVDHSRLSIMKQQRGRSPCSQHICAPAPETSHTRASIALHSSGRLDTATESGQPEPVILSAPSERVTSTSPTSATIAAAAVSTRLSSGQRDQ